MGLYHRENAQEDFLVLAGECLLIVEGEERKLKTWDFFHCPPGTEHIIVGAGKEPAVVLAVGARGRRRKGLVYPVSEVATEAQGGRRAGDDRPVGGVRQLRRLEALAVPGRLAARPLGAYGLSRGPRTTGAQAYTWRMRQILTVRVGQIAGKYGEHAPMATTCCNACRACVTTNVMTVLVGAGATAGVFFTRAVRRLSAKPSS